VQILGAPTLCLFFCGACSKDLSRSNTVELLEQHRGETGLGSVKISNTVLQCGTQQGLWRVNGGVVGNAHTYTTDKALAEYIILLEHFYDDNGSKLLFWVHPTITGIRKGGKPTIRVVDFTWAVDWKTLPPKLQSCLPNSSRLKQSGMATFELHDDGWRFRESR
jgi:hypothetical protein